MTARSLLPDAERAGQVAGQLGELRFRLARAATPDAPGCRSDRLEGAADAFAAARSAPDDADWPALGAALDAALADVDRCDAPGVPAVVARLRGWRDLPPFQP